jgi:small-conductance mechanosensitive channel
VVQFFNHDVSRRSVRKVICATGWVLQVGAASVSPQPQWPKPTLDAMTRILLRTVALLGSWGIGLLVAALIVPRVSVSVSGFIVAVVLFSVAQAMLSELILKLPRETATLFLGATALVLTVVALILASVITHGITIRGLASWAATTVLAWLVTTLVAILLPELFTRDRSGPST